VTVPRCTSTCPCRASGESGRERVVASMVAHSERGDGYGGGTDSEFPTRIYSQATGVRSINMQ
jgi:hypothetical protein